MTNDKKIRLVHWFYYWTSGFISIAEGIFVTLTFGLLKRAWLFKYAGFWCRIISDIQIKRGMKNALLREKAEAEKDIVQEDYFLYDADPNCKHVIISGDNMSGVKCKYCKGWFCY